MARKEKEVLIGEMGPNVPFVPRKDFTKGKFSEKELMDMWRIIGPTVQVNLEAKLPMWKTFAMAYIQGLENGSAVERRNNAPKEEKQLSLL